MSEHQNFKQRLLDIAYLKQLDEMPFWDEPQHETWHGILDRYTESEQKIILKEIWERDNE